jgi:hypothetical protein
MLDYYWIELFPLLGFAWTWNNHLTEVHVLKLCKFGGKFGNFDCRKC